jgi:hypothetical protein
MPADVLEMLPGYAMAFCPTVPGFGTGVAFVDGNKLSRRRLPPVARGDDCTIKPRPSLVA